MTNLGKESCTWISGNRATLRPVRAQDMRQPETVISGNPGLGGMLVRLSLRQSTSSAKFLTSVGAYNVHHLSMLLLSFAHSSSPKSKLETQSTQLSATILYHRPYTDDTTNNNDVSGGAIELKDHGKAGW